MLLIIHAVIIQFVWIVRWVHKEITQIIYVCCVDGSVWLVIMVNVFSVQLVITYQTLAYVMAVQIYAHNVNTIQYIRDLNVLFV